MELSFHEASSTVQFTRRCTHTSQTVYETGMCASVLLEVENKIKLIEQAFAGYWDALDTAPQSAHKAMQQKMYENTFFEFDYIMGVVNSFANDDGDDE
eukprot:3467049-Rhodomonas_salina.1